MAEVKVLFNTIAKENYLSASVNPSEISRYSEINNVFEYVNTKPKTEKFFDLKGNKFCYLDIFTQEVIRHNNLDYHVQYGVFKSARSEFRPNLIDKRTGEERPNPKRISEGDCEKTHFIIYNNNEEVFFLLQRNGTGITINNVINYLTEFDRRRLGVESISMPYRIFYNQVCTNNFLTELENLQRVTEAEIHFNKQLLGSEALNFSSRTTPLQEDIKLIAKATRGDSITNFAVDCFNKIGGRQSPISKVRISGKDAHNNNILIDSNILAKKEIIQSSKNNQTGELDSSQIKDELKRLIKSVF